MTITPGPHEHVLHVSDEGAGLDDDQKTLATSRFWRASTSGDGTGLGLAIVDALATASGGHVDLADAPGGGLTVSVSFPVGAHSPDPVVR